MRGKGLQLRSLAGIDPRQAELPHGTEVLLRADRVVGERRLPQGSVGRVTHVEGPRVTVEFVGVGSIECERDELLPRRHGQALFASRRATDWRALSGCVVLSAVVGSQAWGLADQTSDVDHRGVFALPFSWTSGMVSGPEDLVSADGSSAFWSVGKVLRQALRSDPNTLEMLFVPTIEVLDPLGGWLLAVREAFVSREIYGSFGRYALAQLRRLEQHARLASHRAVVLEWLRRDHSLTLDDVAHRLLEATPGTGSEADRLMHARQWVRQLYRSMADQGLLEANEFAALARFSRERAHDFDLPRELRPKNAYNLLRLIATGTTWLATGRPRFSVEGEQRELLLAVKRGEKELPEVLAIAESMVPGLEKAKQGSPLPERPDLAAADQVMRRINQELARRWIVQAPGPFGADAPPTPEATWAS